MSGTHHRLTLAYRGSAHVHRWWPICTCGDWIGVPRRRRREAEQQYHDHVEAITHTRTRRPRVPTAPDKLPDVLR